MPEILSRSPLRYRDVLSRDPRDPEVFFSDQYASAWRPLLRKLILARFAVESGSRVTVIKDPNGSQGADVIMATLPRSKLLFLLRDGRDVVDSEVASLQPRAWRGRRFDVTATRDELIEFAARNWLARTEIVESAFANHDEALRMMVRYEDLLDDPGGWLSRIYDWCGLEASADQIRATVAALSVDKVAVRTAETFVRTATPGLWREHFDEAERKLLAGILDQKLRQLGYETD
jgi:hypothetical protein